MVLVHRHQHPRQELCQLLDHFLDYLQQVAQVEVFLLLSRPIHHPLS
uniref:Uncharacterized protein n=1 Tax=Populus trichocarpa TaxID=3694 RepID=A9P897_POPTR|nr:unknown [Populus trichocarpa]